MHPRSYTWRGKRRLMRGKLPETVLTRKKVGFDIPAHDWLRTASRIALEILRNDQRRTSTPTAERALRRLDRLELDVELGREVGGDGHMLGQEPPVAEQIGPHRVFAGGDPDQFGG